ncbi:PP2C family protein-serine/threonine phosphatase [Cellulosimicrobium marinum]|uniref:PP2C family protein-serine/threonine phosphatase n=1 Tax=Cellulosimicrobium marinum TaxID=1638992 RepID=UPI001E418C5D|nr:PP2C family protein-serine/threonine phosphatase [Cellulosimicrobium marinum]MCB7135993.1 serine/threonine-protein phosphatase [Cellulosimicrobium marinum]
MRPDWFARATATTSTGALAAEVDWAATPLGRPSTWPQGLRAAFVLCFSTRFPVMFTWGPDLTMVYNDGYRAMLGTDKHPVAMGAPARVVWDEIWDDIGPLFAEVLRSGRPTWTEDARLLMERSGYLEETFFTFSYSPLEDDDGVVRGVLDIATETTGQVVGQRRLGTLKLLSHALLEHTQSPAGLAREFVEAVRGSADLALAEVWFAGPDGLAPVASAGRGTTTSDDVRSDHVRRVTRSGTAVADGPLLVAPLPATQGTGLLGAVLLEAAPTRPYDEDTRAFLRLVASSLVVATRERVAREVEVHDLRETSEALQLAMLPDQLTSHRWTTRYRPADDRYAVGGDWYDVVPLGSGRWGLLVGDCVGHGLHAASLMGQLRSAGRALLIDDQGPAATLTALDRFASALPGAEFATVLCGVLDESAGTLVWSGAGHPPALLVREDDGEWLDEAQGAPLTLAGAARPEQTVVLGASDVLLVYTDGLVERRGENLRHGLDRLAAAAARVVRDTAPDEVADALLTELVGDAARDDVALVVYVGPERARGARAADAAGARAASVGGG